MTRAVRNDEAGVIVGEDRGRGDRVFDMWHVFDAAKRELDSLGLAVAGQIVTARGGRILVRSTRSRDSRADLNVRSAG